MKKNFALVGIERSVVYPIFTYNVLAGIRAVSISNTVGVNETSFNMHFAFITE